MDNLKVVVLDDDPTGTQTVRDIIMLTVWDAVSLESELKAPGKLFFILTNTRAMQQQEARRINIEICQNLRKASKNSQVPFLIISRGDSTLRGHFPGEPEALEEGLQQAFDAWFIIPFFEEGGRITLNNIHYVKEADKLIAVADTPFAKDNSFGFINSDLTKWIEEKTKGKISSNEVVSISIEELEASDQAPLLDKLLSLDSRSMVVVNATSMAHMRTFAKLVLIALGKGKKFLFRSAASWVKAIKETLTGEFTDDVIISDQELKLLTHKPNGGLIVVGSYIAKTTDQLNTLLLSNPLLKTIELNVDNILSNNNIPDFIEKHSLQIDLWLKEKENVLMYTSRNIMSSPDPSESLRIINKVAEVIAAIVKHISVKPSYIIAKGGITSSDIATKSLEIKRATVMGSLLPGVPVIQAGEESKFPSLCYVIFPGNVGSSTSLIEAIEKLQLK